MELKITKVAKIIHFKEFAQYLKELKIRKEELLKFFLQRKLKLENTNKCKYHNDMIHKNLRHSLTEEEKHIHQIEATKLVETLTKPVEPTYESAYECTINADNIIKKYQKINPRFKIISPKKPTMIRLASIYKNNEVFELTRTPNKKHNKRESGIKISKSKLLEYKLNATNTKNIEPKTAATTNLMTTEQSRGNSMLHTAQPSNNFVEYMRKSTQMKKKQVDLRIEKRLKMTIDNWNSTKNSKFYDSGNYDMPLLSLTIK
jgi:hypothetical protein